MRPIEINLEIILKEDLQQYVPSLPSFLTNIANSICQEVHLKLDDRETLFNIGNEYFYGTECNGKLKRVQKKDQLWVMDQIKAIWLCESLSFRVGMLIQQDYLRANIFYLGAAHRGHIGAHYMLGYMFFHGLGVERDSREALKWFEMSLDQNLLFPEFMIKKLEEEGPLLYLRPDIKDREKRLWAEKIVKFLDLPVPPVEGSQA